MSCKRQLHEYSAAAAEVPGSTSNIVYAVQESRQAESRGSEPVDTDSLNILAEAVASQSTGSDPLGILAETVASQPIAFRNYKGQSRQMITMRFLEEGGYFDLPIQVLSKETCGEYHPIYLGKQQVSKSLA